MLTLLHASDFQCGRPFRPDAADALVRFAHELRPDVAVIPGDLTQRAKKKQFATATELIGRLPDVPKILTPGNHDVALFRVWERALFPYRNWRTLVSPDLDSVTSTASATFVALNSSAPRRAIVNGRVDDWQVELARRAFAAAPAEHIRVLVIHHHFVRTPDEEGSSPLPRARRLVAAFESMGVDLLLGGHVHETHVRTSRDLIPEGEGPGLPIVTCGTTTSSRGRGPEKGLNSLNVVRIGPTRIEVVPHLLERGSTSFEPREPSVFARPGAAERSSASTGT